jgi:hypothetical protein
MHKEPTKNKTMNIALQKLRFGGERTRYSYNATELAQIFHQTAW